jgi:uncharacterized protein YjiS (DUF1127 family)
MKNENRAVFDRAPEPIDYAFDLPADEGEIAGATEAKVSPRNIVSRLLVWIAMRWRYRRHRMALLELSDDQLKDIGISRSQAYGSYSRYRSSQSHNLERRRM